MDRNEVLDIIRNYELSIEIHEERFKIICDTVTVNNVTFRDVGILNLCNDVFWIDGDETSIDIEDINKLSISNRMKTIYNRNFKIIEEE